MIRVSTIIPAYNAVATIARAVESALAQNYDAQEIIVVNDGSTDGTDSVVETFGAKLVAINQPNRGRAAARNAGLAVARGEYVAFLDADDDWIAHKLAAQIPILDADSGCVLVYSDAIGVDSAGKVVRNSMQPQEYDHVPTLEDLRKKGIWPSILSSWVMRRSVIEACGGFVESFGRHWGGEDSLLFFQARHLGSFRYLPEPLARYTVATTEEHLRKRFHGIDRSLPANERLRRFFVGEDHYLELIRGRFGQDAPFLRLQKRGLLIPLALLAMHEGDRPLARRAYLSLLRQAPLQVRTHAKLAWTFLPPRMTFWLSGFLSPKYKRALMGPPKNRWWDQL